MVGAPDPSEICFETETAQLPPPPVMDSIDAVLTFLCGLTVCVPD